MAEPVVTLGTIIAYVESKGDPQAMRFEPLVHDRIHDHIFSDKIVSNIRAIHKCTYETACVIYSSSFGKYQIMGCNLYDPAFINLDCNIFTYCGTSEAAGIKQDYAFSMFTRDRNIAYSVQQLSDPDNRRRFAIKYNGSLSYADNIKDAMVHFGIHL